VTVQTPNGVSNAKSFTYQTSGPVPVSFTTNVLDSVTSPTRAAWGPDGRLYVGGIDGKITIYQFNDDYGLTNKTIVNTISALSNGDILGLAFNPFDPPSPVRLYVGHSQLYANGGGAFTGPSPYSGQVSVLTGPNFSTVQPLITGLPVSNHDHGINGMEFDDQGDLLFAVGGNTNAGIKHPNIGDLPESPLSAAILRARITKSGFNGTVTYKTSDGATNMDQVFGGVVDVESGVDVEVYSPGYRNPFDIIWTTSSVLFGTDNGPNGGYGAASTSATTQGPDPTGPDEIMRIGQGHYYGHPNRNRGRYDNRQNVYRAHNVAAILGQYTAQLATTSSSTNGIEEYRATAFNNQLRGNLLAQKWDGQLYSAKLSANGRTIQTLDAISGAPSALDIIASPGGVLLGIDYTNNMIEIARPNDSSAPPTIAYDIFPWRARADGTATFVIGGKGLGNLSNTTVTIGGTQANLTSVSATRIRGVIPAKSNPTAQLLDVVVQTNSQVSTISKAFRYLLQKGSGFGRWETATAMPISLGEVAAGVINGVLYMVGEGASATLAYDTVTGNWLSNLAVKPFTGHHHGAEVLSGKLYLLGGLGGNSAGKMQIYNPNTNSWSTGPDIPFATGSASTCVIAGKIYVAGGIVSGSTVTNAAVYNPATNTWSAIAPMPAGRNHAAAATDGQKFYVFGGRGPGSGNDNVVAEGFNDVQIYNPTTNSWQTSATTGSPIPPLPQKRGGMGKAAFLGDEFYVIGGETTAGGVPNGVYNRVDVFNPTTLTWRLDSPMPTARHGIFPVIADGKILVPGGGTNAGFSSSNIFEIFTR
jgi:N-acetylneuraminic acid mutarotase/glucose/arabinose dehydrogenase